MQVTLTGFHGTSFDVAKKIVLEEFELSKGDDEWLGDGVYFFVNGISDKPSKQAEKWAIAQSWDVQLKAHKYKRYSVLKCQIDVDEDKFLDLTNSDGVEILDYIIECHMTKLKKIGKKLNYIDGFVINFARKEEILPIEVVKGNFYIKFTNERVNRIARRTPNCTICSVFSPQDSLIKKELFLTNEIVQDETQ